MCRVYAMSSPKSCSLPWISIVTVVRNGVDLLEETIRNVLDQPYENLDFLVLDGCSTDGSVDIIQKYADRITWWESTPDNGIYDAMNKGWHKARDNSYILFLGAGDKIISLPHDMYRYSPDEVIFGAVCIGDGKEFIPRTGLWLRIYNSLHHQALLVNKRLHSAPPFDTRYSHYADFDFNQRLLKKGCRFIFDKDFRSFACPGGVTQELHLDESLAIIQKNFGTFWKSTAECAYLGIRALPLLGRLRPFRKIGVINHGVD